MVVALSQPLSGLVFVLDGVLIGAGDGRWLAGAQVAVLLAYLPLVLWVRPRRPRCWPASDTAATQAHAVTVLWWAVVAFMALRGLALGWRARGDAWLVTGAAR